MTSLHTTKWFLNISRTNIDCKTRLWWCLHHWVWHNRPSSSYVPQAKGPETTARWFRIGRRLITPCGGLMLYISSCLEYGLVSCGKYDMYLCMHLYYIYRYILDAYKSFTKRDWEKKCVLHIISRLYNGSFNQHMEFEEGASHTSLPNSPSGSLGSAFRLQSGVFFL